MTCSLHHIPLDKRSESCPLCRASADLNPTLPQELKIRMEQLALGAKAIVRAARKAQAELSEHRFSFTHATHFVLADLEADADRLVAILTHHPLPSDAGNQEGRVDSLDLGATSNYNNQD